MIFDETRILADLQIEDLVEPQHRAIAEVIGIENFAKLIIFAGGDCYYIPTVAKFKRTLLIKHIKTSKKNINSYSRRELIRKFGLCRKTVDGVFLELKGAN